MSKGLTYLQQIALEIQEEEDKRILDVLLNKCKYANHTAHGKPLWECSEPECITEYIHSS
jgi:hypothetical protein